MYSTCDGKTTVLSIIVSEIDDADGFIILSYPGVGGEARNKIMKTNKSGVPSTYSSVEAT
jgi:hypothetical protein